MEYKIKYTQYNSFNVFVQAVYCNKVLIQINTLHKVQMRLNSKLNLKFSLICTYLTFYLQSEDA